MGIKNKDGETPGQILGWGPPWDSAEEEEDEEVSKEREWRQKLQGELEDEWQEVIGRFEGEESIATPSCPPSLLGPVSTSPGPLPVASWFPYLSCTSSNHSLSPTTSSHLPNR